MQFCKIITDKSTRELKKRLGLGLSPAFLVLRNGEIVERINDLDESDPKKTVDKTPWNAESNDELKVKAVLDRLCKEYQ